tara:strand:- start:792 stop:932 length:141 start_codon:yes stop_codon:yes gene_type:complete
MDVDASYEANFQKWLRWANRERRRYNETILSEEEGRIKFNSFYGRI